MNDINVDDFRRRVGPALELGLRLLLSKAPGLLAAQVCTSDGFEIASVLRSAESHRRVAAMVSSLHALAIAMARETELGLYTNLTIETTAGNCLMMSIPGTDDSLLLAVVAPSSLLFGRLHQTAKDACVQLAECLKAASPA